MPGYPGKKQMDNSISAPGLLLLDMGSSMALFAQNFFPMPAWFKENVGRNQTYDQPLGLTIFE
jgi:hypothetical protein